MITATEQQTGLDDIVLADLDFPTPCGAIGERWHPIHGTGPAVWIVRLVPCCRSKVGADV